MYVENTTISGAGTQTVYIKAQLSDIFACAHADNPYQAFWLLHMFLEMRLRYNSDHFYFFLSLSPSLSLL